MIFPRKMENACVNTPIEKVQNHQQVANKSDIFKVFTRNFQKCVINGRSIQFGNWPAKISYFKSVVAAVFC